MVQHASRGTTQPFYDVSCCVGQIGCFQSSNASTLTTVPARGSMVQPLEHPSQQSTSCDSAYQSYALSSVFQFATNQPNQTMKKIYTVHNY